MLRAWLSRLISTLSILLIGMGGGSLPVLDGLLFHDRGAPETFRDHFEAGSGCHADGCAIKSTAQLVRFAAGIGTPARLAPSYDLTAPPPSLPALLSRALSGQPLSRAPPQLG
jgi:hypothetical protein